MSDAALKDRQATLATKLITLPINVTSATDAIIRVIQPGQLFMVYGFYLRNVAAQIATLTWKSGTTAISGAMVLYASSSTAYDLISIFCEVPILKGRVLGEDLVLTVAGTTPSVQGWCIVTEAAF